MTDNVTQFPEPEKMPDLLVGPFQKWEVRVMGRKLPLLTGYREGDKIWLVCDDRLAAGPFSEAEAYQAAMLAGQCMAVITGYPNLEAEKKMEYFAPKMTGLSSIPD